MKVLVLDAVLDDNTDTTVSVSKVGRTLRFVRDDGGGEWSEPILAVWEREWSEEENAGVVLCDGWEEQVRFWLWDEAEKENEALRARWGTER